MEEKTQTQQIQTEQLMTVAEVCLMLAVRPSWIYNRRHAHSLPFPTIKVGGFLRFRRSDLQIEALGDLPEAQHLSHPIISVDRMGIVRAGRNVIRVK